MQFIKFNDAESAKERSQTQPLSLEKEKKAIRFINQLITSARLKDAEELVLIQNFVNHYQNMSHLCTINGLFVEGKTIDTNPLIDSLIEIAEITDLPEYPIDSDYFKIWKICNDAIRTHKHEDVNVIFKADTSKGGYQPTIDTMNHIRPNGDGKESDEEIEAKTNKNLELIGKFCEHLKDDFEIEITEDQIITFFEP